SVLGRKPERPDLRTHGRVAVIEFRLRRTPATTQPSGLRRQRPLDGPGSAEDDEQVGTCGAVGLGTALLPVLQRARVEAVPHGEGSLREAALAPDRPDLVGSE